MKMESKESENREQEAESKKQRIEDKEQKTKSRKHKSKKAPGLGRLYFGLVLIGFGALLLLDALDLVAFNFALLFAFILPLILVGVGLSLLKIQSRIIGFVLVALTLAGFVFAAVFARTNEPTNEQFSIAQSADEAAIQLNLGASDINVDGSQLEDVLVQGEFESSYSKLKAESDVKEGVQEVTLTTEGSTDNFWNVFQSGASDLDVQVAEGVPLSLSIGAGAVDLDMDLRNVVLSGLSIETGASDVDVRLGEPSQETNVTVDAGVSSITFDVPKGTALRLQSEGALNSVEISDVTSQTNGTYVTENFADAEVFYDISIDAGLSEVVVKWY